MAMRIDESREDDRPVQVQDRIHGKALLQIGLCAHTHYSAVGYRYRIVHRERIVHGINDRIVQEKIGLRLCCTRTEQEDRQREDEVRWLHLRKINEAC